MQICTKSYTTKNIVYRAKKGGRKSGKSQRQHSLDLSGCLVRDTSSQVSLAGMDLTLGDAMLCKDVTMLPISLLHLPVEGTGSGEESIDGFERTVAGFRVDYRGRVRCTA